MIKKEYKNIAFYLKIIINTDGFYIQVKRHMEFADECYLSSDDSIEFKKNLEYVCEKYSFNYTHIIKELDLN